MANKYKNETIVKVGEVEILLRPDFENLSAFESNVITLDQFAFNLTKARIPAISQIVQALYYFQVARKADGTRLHSLEELNEMVMNFGGLKVNIPVMAFLSKCVSGYDSASDAEKSVDKAVSESEKKS